MTAILLASSNTIQLALNYMNTKPETLCRMGRALQLASQSINCKFNNIQKFSGQEQMHPPPLGDDQYHHYLHHAPSTVEEGGLPQSQKDAKVFHHRQGTKPLKTTLTQKIKQASLNCYNIGFWHIHSRAYSKPVMVLASCITAVMALYWVLHTLFMLMSKDFTTSMTVYLNTPGNTNHYHTYNCTQGTSDCTLCYVLATINTHDMVFHLRHMVNSSKIQNSEM